MDHPTSLITCPVEILWCIGDHLLPPDRVALVRTCHAINAVLTESLWRHVELHYRVTHEGVGYLGAGPNWERASDQDRNNPEAFGDRFAYEHAIHQPSGRAYARPEIHYHLRWRKAFDGFQQIVRGPEKFVRSDLQSNRENIFMRAFRLTTAPRWHGLAEHVKSLCMSIGIDGEVMAAIATLKNLGSLELVGLALEEHPVDAPSVALPRLKNLRLCGYFPVAFVRQVYGIARRITHMDLGLLATTADDRAHGETLLIDEEMVGIPMLPHSHLWLPAVEPPDQSPALTHLHLTKPFISNLGIYQKDLRHIPEKYEVAPNAEWVTLIQGVAGSLRQLVLEHRLPVTEDGRWDLEDWGPIPPGNRYEQLDGDVDFCQTVLQFLAHNRSLFPNLKRLELRGIRIDDIPPRDPGR